MYRRVPMLAVPLLVVAVSCQSASRTHAPLLTLTVTPSRNEFTHDGTPSALELTLNLAASAVAPVAVCTLPTGSIHVRRLTRNGVRVKPQRTGRTFYEHPSVLQPRSLVTLAPGGSVSIRVDMLRGVTGDLELEDVKFKNWGPEAFLYSLPAPGVYGIQLTYHYTGSNGGHVNVVRRVVPSNLVTFTLVR